MDTIFALATALGRSGVGVIRISGPESVKALGYLNASIPDPHTACLRSLRSVEGTLLDEALVVVFPQYQSFTGEQTVEIQCHGSVAVIKAILEELSHIPQLRPADPGEFTRRALGNGRLDLAQVEGLADLLEAETEVQRRQALQVFSGELGRLAEEWRSDLIRAAALVEATIDFADEDVPVDVAPEVRQLIEKTRKSLECEISGIHMAERVRAGFEVAIVGAPNVGKSTLLNSLAGRDAAITSEFAGTTRDVIEVRMDLSGLPVTFLDTAGIRETDDVVESIGIGRAKQRAESADLRIFLVESGRSPDFEIHDDDIILQAKADLLETGSGGISGRTGQGVPDLIQRISSILKNRSSAVGVATRLRHQVAMKRACVSLSRARELIELGEAQADLVAEELRSSVRALDFLVGRVDVEVVLDEIFSSFCIGK